ncbi:MAG: helix-turn-helix domain-containing protein [bacterium]|nr:helix-turn-helix domain-containing protein [bacterium]
MEKLENIVACNLTYLRKQAKLTQLEFGEKFNYSDKTVSKWELGTLMPSVDVLKEIADFYNVSVDYILTEHKTQKEFESEIAKVVNPKEKIIFIALAVTIAWVIAAVIFAVGRISKEAAQDITKQIFYEKYWIAFLWAVPASFIIMAYFTRRFFKGSILPLSFLSCFIWTLLASIYTHITIFFNQSNYWFLFIVGVPIQALLLLLILRKKN